MTTAQTAAALGIADPATIARWLEGGHFPGARCVDGVWTFDPAEIERVRAEMERIRAEGGRVKIPDLGDAVVDVPVF